jgi:hypothetical protein
MSPFGSPEVIMEYDQTKGGMAARWETRE